MTKVLVILASVAVIALVAGAVLVLKGGSSKSADTQANATASPAPSASPAGKLEVTDETTGNGTEAKEGSTITVSYVGSLTDGSVFDSTEKQGGQPATFELAKGKLIEGWVQGIPGMKVGGKRKLVIPPELGYGAQAQQGIPANSTLVFEITLLAVK